MTISRAKPIEQLSKEVAPYDLVIVPDPALASALNRRLERPHFGPFAITPRRLAARRRETAEDRLAFLQVISQTDLDWKRAAAAIGDVLQCWEYEGAADAIRSYDGFDTPAIRRVLETVESLETTSRKLTEYEVDSEAYPSVAVVGAQQLTPLERSILPSAYDEVERFSDDPFDLPPFRLFESPAAAVDALVSTITPETAADVAVVLEDGSEYSTLLESALETDGIPYYGGPGFADNRDVRCFLELLRAAFAGSDTRVGDVRSVLTHVGAAVEVEHDEKRLFEVDEPGLERVFAYCASSPEGTVGDALATYEGWIERDLERLREELEELDVLDETLTESVADRLQFYFQTYDVPLERENEGVLLADATSTGFVDRPVVCCLGLDEGWTHTAPRRPWADRDEEFERNVHRFQSLLQSGVEQHHLVVDVAGGSPVSPTLYFDALLEEPLERFSDGDAIEHSRTVRTGGRGFEREPVAADVEADPVETISQSSLNSLVNSPRDYLFGRLVAGPDRHYFAEGNLFHDFAELFVTHPDVVLDGDGEPDPAVLDEVVDVMCEQTRPFHRDVDLETRRTRYRAGLTTIVAFLADRRPDADDEAFDFLTPESGWGTNVFATYFDRPIDSPLTERWFDDDELGLKGKIDLVLEPRHLLDFKSGSRTRASAVMKRSALDPPGDPPNYQALLYLTYFRSLRPGERLHFTFFHFLECLDDVVAGDLDLTACLTTVGYRPVRYDEYVRTRAVFEGLCEDAANACTKTFSTVDHEVFLAVLEAQPIPKTRDGAELAESPFGRALTEQMVDAVGDYKYVEKGCLQACRYLAALRNESYFADDLDEFERFVEERLAEVNAYRRGEERFPIDGPGGEPNYRYVDHRDLLLEGGADAWRDGAASTADSGAVPVDETDVSPATGGEDR
ncbi:PD-(D/E)XK nuclease family protein [Natronobiforma cellulositropha]|uniref:PD-(D/E)XK nuclease family protein n=1 Tax=Natronobiforma cellulositropha TaxID=1679076 RepID=UPI0021D5F86C|nr:PD-(D/E)XK nuclease family protein [Natronobiforma cellulositropha]